MTRWAILNTVLVGFLLTGCGLLPQPGPTLSPTDTAYLAEVTAAGVKVSTADRKVMIELAHEDCSSLRVGVPYSQVVGTGTSSGFSDAEARAITDAAIRAYCPEQT